MKIIASVVALLVSLWLFEASASPPAPDKQPLYLHFMTATVWGEPLRRIVSTRVILSEDIEIAVDQDRQTLAGRIEARGGKYFASVSGHVHTSSMSILGEIELGKPFIARVYSLSGDYEPVCFILSTSADPSKYLKAPKRHTE